MRVLDIPAALALAAERCPVMLREPEPGVTKYATAVSRALGWKAGALQVLPGRSSTSGGVRQPDARAYPDLFAWTDTAAATAIAGVNLMALDVTLDGHRYGERFDVVVGVVPST
jgi:hypothetical protein